MLEALFSGGGNSNEFATVAVRLPKATHKEMGDLCALHGLSLQAVGKASLDAALLELRGIPKPVEAPAAATEAPTPPQADPVPPVATDPPVKGGKSGKGGK